MSLGKRVLYAFAGAALAGTATLGIGSYAVGQNIAENGCIETFEEVGEKGSDSLFVGDSQELTPLGEEFSACMVDSGAITFGFALPALTLAGGVGGWVLAGRSGRRNDDNTPPAPGI